MPAPSPSRQSDRRASESIADIASMARLIEELRQGAGPETLNDRVLSRVLEEKFTQDAVLNFRPEADYFFNLRAEVGTRFDQEANSEVAQRPAQALAAALTGAKLTPENRVLAANQLGGEIDALASRGARSLQQVGDLMKTDPDAAFRQLATLFHVRRQ